MICVRLLLRLCIPKTLVKHLVKWVADSVIDESSQATLLDIVDTPISPELIPADEDGNISQKTEDLVGPYELHDFFLYYTLRFGFRPSKIFYLAQYAFAGKYTDETIKKWLTTFFRRFFSQQFKRSCLPDGPKVGSCLWSCGRAAVWARIGSFLSRRRHGARDSAWRRCSWELSACGRR